MKLLGPLWLLLIIFVPILLKVCENYEPHNPTHLERAVSQFGFLMHKCHRPRLSFSPTSTSKQMHTVLLVLLLAGDISTNPGPSFKLSFANMRSIKNKSATVSDFTLSEKPDVLCVCETWLTQQDTSACISDLTPTDYAFHQHPDRKSVV